MRARPAALFLLSRRKGPPPSQPPHARSAFGTGFGAQPPAPPAHNPNKDFEVPSPPGDSVSCLAVSPVANLLVAGAWDNQVRCWAVQPSGQAVPKAATSHDQPVLCAAWSADGSTVFSGEKLRGSFDAMEMRERERRPQAASHGRTLPRPAWGREQGMLLRERFSLHQERANRGPGGAPRF